MPCSIYKYMYTICIMFNVFYFITGRDFAYYQLYVAPMQISCAVHAYLHITNHTMAATPLSTGTQT